MSKPLSALLAAVIACLPLAACGQEARAPAFDAAQAAHPGYISPPGFKTECFGRLLVDMPETAEWANRFSEILGPDRGGEGLTYDGRMLSAGINRPLSVLKVARASAGWGLQIYNREVNETIALRREIVEDARKENRLDDARQIEASIEDEKKKLETFREIDLGIPDSFSQLTDNEGRDNIWVVRWVNGYRFSFRVRAQKGESLDAVKARAKDFAARFRARRPYEIPTEPGVCLPNAFIADDGKTSYDFQHSFRFKSAPGVIHTLRTGKNDALTLPKYRTDTFDMEDKLYGAHLPPLGGRWGPAATQQKMQIIELTQTFVGPYETSYAGFSVHPAFNGKLSKERNFHIVSGISGLPESDVVPFIYYEMNGFTQGMDSSLKTPVPPLEQSLKVMHTVLKSIRLRTPESARTAMARQTAEPFPAYNPTFKAFKNEIVINCSKATAKARWRGPENKPDYKPDEWSRFDRLSGDSSVLMGDPWYVVRSDAPPERMHLVPKEDIVLSGVYAEKDGFTLLTPKQVHTLIQARCTGKDNFWLVDPIEIYRMPMAIKGAARK